MEPPPAKRQRMTTDRRERSVTQAPAVRAPTMQRYIAFDFPPSSPAAYPQAGPTRWFMPEEAAREIGSYRQKLELGISRSYCNTTITISIAEAPDEQLFDQAVRFLTYGYLPQLSAYDGRHQEALITLVCLFEFSVLLSIQKLGTGVIDHIEDFQGLTLEMLVDLAESYYATGRGDLRVSDLGLYIKGKLKQFMPCVNGLKADYHRKVQQGELGKVYTELLMANYEESKQESERKMHFAMENVIKIEDDRELTIKLEDD